MAAVDGGPDLGVRRRSAKAHTAPEVARRATMGPAVSKLVFQPPRPASYTNTPNFFWLYTARKKKIPAFFINRA